MSNPATFSERSRRPRIQTAEELAPYLSHVQPCGRSPYTHTADAPCHTSKNPGFGDSFWFGDALDPSGNPFGGLVVTCWGCLQKGSGPGSARAMLERVEDAFGVGIQVRWPGWDVDTGTTKAGYGELRYREPGFQAYGPPILRPGVFTSQLQKRDAGPSTIRWFATQGPETFTLADLQATRVWIAGTSLKAPWQESRRAARTAGRDTPVCFRQSLDDVDVTPGDTRTGLEVARDGGPAICRPKKGDPTPFPVRVRPWGTLGRIVGGIAAMSNPDGVHPCLVLSGGKEHACEVDVMAVDLDYHPDQDVDGVGRAFRDALAETLAKAGAPMFGSSSGNGWHCLLRQDADFLREAQENGTDIRFPKKTADPTKDDIGGSAFAELFHAGTKRLILLRWKNPCITPPQTPSSPWYPGPGSGRRYWTPVVWRRADRRRPRRNGRRAQTKLPGRRRRRPRPGRHPGPRSPWHRPPPGRPASRPRSGKKAIGIRLMTSRTSSPKRRSGPRPRRRKRK